MFQRSLAVDVESEPDLDAVERKRFELATLSHLDAAFNLARWLTRDDHGAEDVVQEAYLRAARYFASFRGGDGRVWLLGIVRRVAFDWLAKERTQVSVAFHDELHGAGDESANPAIELLRKCGQEIVRSALEMLPPQLREAIVLRELEGLAYQEIAAVAEVPIGTVMSRISRGRQQLHRLLTASGEGEVA